MGSRVCRRHLMEKPELANQKAQLNLPSFTPDPGWPAAYIQALGWMQAGATGRTARELN